MSYICQIFGDFRHKFFYPLSHTAVKKVIVIKDDTATVNTMNLRRRLLTQKKKKKKKKKKISHRQLGPLRGSSSPFQHFEPARVKPN